MYCLKKSGPKYKFSTQGKGSSVGFLSELKTRSILSVEGPDAKSLLQGIATNDVRKFDKNEKLVSIHSAFLGTNGRVLTDAFIIRPKSFAANGGGTFKRNEYWLDVSRSCLEQLERHLKKYVLRKRVAIESLSSELKVLAMASTLILPNPESEGMEAENMIKTDESLGPAGSAAKSKEDGTEDEENDDLYDNLSFVDPRNHSLGMRFITSSQEGIEIEGAKSIETVEEQFYQRFRIMNGVFEGKEVADMIPFQANFDFSKSISLNKGCYLGQELTARAFHTGVIRKRLIPFVITENPINTPETYFGINMHLFNENFERNLMDKPITNSKQEIIGKVLYNTKNFGFAVMSYTKLNQEPPLKVEGLYITPYLTHWLSSNINSYLETVSKRPNMEAL